MEVSEIRLLLKEEVSKNLELGIIKFEGHLNMDSKLWNDLKFYKSKYYSIYNDFKKNIIINSDYYQHIDKVRLSVIELIDCIHKHDLNNHNIEKHKDLNETINTLVVTESRVDTQRIDVEITIDGEFENYTLKEQDKLLKAIEGFLKLKNGELKIKKKRTGSIKITIELTKKMAKKLVTGIKDGLFSEFMIRDITILEDDSIESKSNRTKEAIVNRVLQAFLEKVQIIQKLYPHLTEDEAMMIALEIHNELNIQLSQDKQISFVGKKPNGDYEISIYALEALIKKQLSNE